MLKRLGYRRYPPPHRRPDIKCVEGLSNSYPSCYNVAFAEQAVQDH